MKNCVKDEDFTFLKISNIAKPSDIFQDVTILYSIVCKLLLNIISLIEGLVYLEFTGERFFCGEPKKNKGCPDN